MSTQVRIRVPELGTAAVDDVASRVGAADVTVPFDPERMECLAEFARRLGRRSASHPEARALSYWLRRTELARMAAAFKELETPRLLHRPRGTVFHVPPANVDTMFVYSWAISAMLGNRNIVRLSSRTTEQAELILGVLGEVLTSYPNVAAANVMVEYGHDDEVSRALSAASDVRVLWGGDATVRLFRNFPLPPHATELTFSDRTSLAAISVDAYAGLTEAGRDDLAGRFVLDSYVFDQMGCSSPRLLVWVGGADHAPHSQDFHARIAAAAAAKGYVVDTSTSIAKLGQAYRGAIDFHVTSLSRDSAALTVLGVREVAPMPRDFCGGGFLYESHVGSLVDLASSVDRRHQTLAVFGFDDAEARALALAANGRGIDRIVPIGQALQFNRHWDGYDLFAEFTRQVTIVTDGGVPQ